MQFYVVLIDEDDSKVLEFSDYKEALDYYFLPHGCKRVFIEGNKLHEVDI